MARDYVVRLMKIKCSMGTVENYINVDIDHGIFVGQNQQPLMNANDHTDKNIMPFGIVFLHKILIVAFVKPCLKVLSVDLLLVLVEL